MKHYMHMGEHGLNSEEMRILRQETQAQNELSNFEGREPKPSTVKERVDRAGGPKNQHRDVVNSAPEVKFAEHESSMPAAHMSSKQLDYEHTLQEVMEKEAEKEFFNKSQDIIKNPERSRIDYKRQKDFSHKGAVSAFRGSYNTLEQ